MISVSCLCSLQLFNISSISSFIICEFLYTFSGNSWRHFSDIFGVFVLLSSLFIYCRLKSGNITSILFKSSNLISLTCRFLCHVSICGQLFCMFSLQSDNRILMFFLFRTHVFGRSLKLSDGTTISSFITQEFLYTSCTSFNNWRIWVDSFGVFGLLSTLSINCLFKCSYGNRVLFECCDIISLCCR